ncbi:MAG: hypothetical protein M5U27_08540 [Gaiella sp.]|nr:hypothetical protein [Gaiella sp.]
MRRFLRRISVRLVVLGTVGVVALAGAGSALAADNPAPLPRVGYCLSGKFVNLALGQPLVDPMYEGAVVANYIKGVGITCKAPPPGWVSVTTAPDEFGVPGRLYPYWVPPATS